MDTFGSRVSQALRFSALALALVFSVVACTKKGKDISVTAPSGEKLTLEYKDTLRVRLASEPPSLDWHISTDTESNKVTTNTMEGLAEYDFSGKEPVAVPALAEKWETKDNKTWVITLKQGVKWSDGEPLTAQHFVDGFQRLLEPATASEYSYFLFVLKNGQAYNSSKIKDFSQVGVKITAPNELTLELERPMSFLPLLFTHHSTFPIRLDVVKKHGDKWTEPGNIVTLGPYNLKVWEHDKQLVLERNPNYHGKPALIKNIVFIMIQEVTTAISLFDADKLDSVDNLPAQELRKLKTRPEFAQMGTLTIQYYGFNTKKAPMDNVKFRQAIAHAIDRQQIVDVLAGGQTPMTSFVPVGMFGYEANRGLPFNIEKAKQLLKEAGYTDPAKYPKLQLKINTQENHQLVAENVQAQLKTNLGIDMEISNEEWKVFLSTLKSNTPMMYRMGWQGDYPDPDNFLNLMTSYSENNRTKWGDKTYDGLVEKAVSVSERSSRADLYSQAQKILVENQVPLVPLYAQVSHYLIKQRVGNYPINVLGHYDFSGVSLK